MDDVYLEPRPRIVASMMKQNVGKCVTMMGIVAPEKISTDGSSFQMSTESDKEITVLLSSGLNELLDGIVEVTGTVDQQENLHCVVYRQLNSSESLDIEAYNAAIKMTHKFPNLCSYSQ
uniref:Replication protein A 14 kDa subunit-like n=1 Tax=Ciona intestinalis TaxID=7719 RepID=H2XJH9_CIOIN|nr:replication protein A 14 kDa subunit-like [Ciona intestinalis]|eukprot:XP_026691486.1 replication protein A 14 kDa subunit-like [Ciona intestinalis]